MSAHDTLKQMHMDAAEKEWDRAVERVRECLHRKGEDGPLIRELVSKLISMPSQARFAALGGAHHTYPVHTSWISVFQK